MIHGMLSTKVPAAPGKGGRSENEDLVFVSNIARMQNDKTIKFKVHAQELDFIVL